jgi:Na+/H+-dicarboxylate symporter
MFGVLKTQLWARVLLGLVLGVVAGLALRQAGLVDVAVQWIKPWGDGFVRLVRMLVVPLIFTTLVAGMVGLGDPRKLGSLGLRTLGMYFATTWAAVAFGLVFAELVRPGAGIDVATASADAAETIRGQAETGPAFSLVDRLLAIIPTNPVEALARGDALPIIFFSLIFGAGVLVSGEKGAAVARGFESAADVMLRVTEFVMQTAPFGVFALMTWVMATQGLAVLDNYLKLALALYLGCIVHALVTYGGIIRILCNLPVWRFFRGMADAMAVAFSTSSSNATLPVTMACVTDNLGVKRPIASFVLPLGATVNMDGTALYQGVIAVFAAQAFGIDLTWGQYFAVMLAATGVSVATAGIPSASLFLAFVTLDVIGVRGEDAVLLVALIFPFDRLLDMMRTTVNITGDAAVAVAVAKWEGELDEETFRRPAKV